MIIIGIDLSGPANVQDTVYAAFVLENGRLTHQQTLYTATDEMIWQQTAYACAFAAWKWVSQESRWIAPAEPPFHPFPFAC